MKIWMKYLMAALVGLALALAVPLKDTGLASALSFLLEISIRIGRYALLPLVLFSVPVAVFEPTRTGSSGSPWDGPSSRSSSPWPP